MLHGQRPRQDFDWIAIFVIAYLVNKSVSRKRVVLNLALQKRGLIGFFNCAAERSSNRSGVADVFRTSATDGITYVLRAPESKSVQHFRPSTAIICLIHPMVSNSKDVESRQSSQ
ncbi:MAG: hypothetical protein DME60_02995 [Verrucomicrobia bacterium]|nr:MAG: hypothetical protein DME60_02995 [Verrucomicrobiota bacterium]